MTLTVPADGAEAAMAAACGVLGAGCRERALPGGGIALDFWVPAPGRAAVDALRRLGAGPVDARPETQGWRDATRRFHRPVEVAGLRVRPPWEGPRPPLLDVVIDPGMAFGTAQHATTRGCLELLASLPGRGTLLDAGCGSGVLAIAARRLGFDPVWAVDDDPLAVEAAIANARRNGVGLRVGRRRIGGDALPQAEVVLANLTTTVLGLLAAALPPPGPRFVVASGLRPAEVAGAAGAFARHGLEPVREVGDREWSAVLLGRG